MNIDPNPNDGDIVFCPRCGTKNTEEQDSHPNGGDLYVAEDLGSEGIDFWDSAVPYKCLDCETRFYIGDD